MKKIILIGAALILVFLGACGGAGNSNEGVDSSGSGTDEKIKIAFYGNIVDQASMEEMFQKLQEKLPEYDIEPIAVDFENLDQNIRTGIVGGDPADIYYYWPQNMTKLIQDELALDLTPYLEENDGEWKNTFDPNLLSLGEYEGKYYNAPLSAAFPAIFINKEIFDEAGVEVKEEWTWEEFMDASKKIKEKTDAYPFAIASRPTKQSWLIRQGVMSLAKKDGVLEDLGNGKIEGTSKYFDTALENIKDLYDSSYWYPGEGALNVTNDEALAAFNRGEVAMLAEVAGQVNNLRDQVDFELDVAKWPAMGEPVVLGGADGYFIPANAKNPDASVEVLKTFLSADIQSIHLDHGYPAANVNVESDDPLLQRISSYTEDLYPYEFHFESDELTKYYEGELVPGYLLGNNKDEVLKRLEDLRQKTFE